MTADIGTVSVPRIVRTVDEPAPRRTDPRSVIAKGVGGLPGAILPLAALAFSTRDDGLPLSVVLPGAVAVLLLIFGLSYAQWRRTTYRVGPADIRVESGLLSRSARSVPYHRIHDVSLEQSLVPRLLGLTVVRFETGAGEKDELTLAYLPVAEGERLRELVRERRDPAGIASPTGEPSSQDRVLFAMDPRRVATLGLFQFSLVVVGVVAGAVQQFDFLLPFDPWELEEWQEVLAGPGAWLAGLGVAAQAVGAILAVLSLLLIGSVSGLLRTALREWGFTFTRNAKGFRRRRGLLTRTDVVMPAQRVQAIAMTTGPVRHRFGWHAAAFVSLANDGGSGDHVVAPLARVEEIAPIVAEAGFPLPPEGLEWRPLDRAYAIVRGLRSAARWLFIAGVLAVNVHFLPPGFWSDYRWLLLPLVIGSLRAAYVWREARGERYALDERLLYRKGGWLAPHVSIASREKLHSAEIHRSPLAWRFGYVALKLGLAGGSFAIPALPPAEARRLRAALIESMTKRDFSAVT